MIIKKTTFGKKLSALLFLLHVQIHDQEVDLPTGTKNSIKTLNVTITKLHLRSILLGIEAGICNVTLVIITTH